MLKNKFTKIILTFAILTLLMVAAGCVPVAKVYVCADGSEVTNLDECKTQEQTSPPKIDTTTAVDTKPEVVEKEAPIKVLGDGAKPLFEKTIAINNIKFNYFRSDDPYTQNRYFVTKDKMKVELNLKTKFLPGETFDTIYFDMNKKTAIGYCERQAREVCTPPDKQFNLAFEDYRIATPYTWVENAETADTTGRSKKVDGRQIKEVTFTFNGKNGIMWMDSFFGAPVEVEFDGINYRYDNMLINDAKDADFVHKPTP